MKDYTIKTIPGVFTRYALHYNGQHVFSGPDRAAVEAMRDQSKAAREYCEDEFFVSYVEAVYFTEAGEDSEIDPDAPLSEETRGSFRVDCEVFQRDNAALLARAYAVDGYTPAQAGQDYWLTRNGHGCGFWDRGLGAVGDALSRAARDAGGVDVYQNDAGEVEA